MGVIRVTFVNNEPLVYNLCEFIRIPGLYQYDSYHHLLIYALINTTDRQQAEMIAQHIVKVFRLHRRKHAEIEIDALPELASVL